MSTPQAESIARAYLHAVAERNVEAIVSLSAADIACTSPAGHLHGIEGFRAFHAGFAKMLTGLTVLAVHGDDKQAVVVYDAETHPVPHALVAEFITVEGGKLASTHVIYDATPFAAFRAAAAPH